MKGLAAGVLVVTLAAVAVFAQALQLYRDPRGLFTLSYPAGWQVVQRSGVTAFTPGDGLTFFSILPTIDIAGSLGAEAVFQSIVVDEFGKLPAFKVVSRKVRPLEGAPGGDSLEAMWSWTHPESKTPKRAWILISAQPISGANRTAAGFVMYEAPARDWRRMEPLFKQMLQSLRVSRPR